MKKLLFVFMAACAMMFTACQSCSDQPEKKDAVVIATDDMDELIEKSVIAIQTAYPEYTFYEASGRAKMTEDSIWGVDRSTFQIVFGKINDNATVIGTVVNDTLNLEQIDEPWLEDIHTTPFVPTDLDFAIKTLQKSIDIDPTNQWCVLRHQLFPGEAEPRWFIGSAYNCSTVNVYSLKINDPLKDMEGFYVKHTGLAAEKTEQEAPAAEE